jgi:hypothetical protein
MTTKVAALVAGAGITLGIIIVVSGPNQKPTAPLQPITTPTTTASQPHDWSTFHEWQPPLPQWRRVGYREWLRDPTLTAPAASRSTVNTNRSSADRPGRCLVKLGRSAGLPRPDHVARSIASKAPRDC